MFESKLAKEVKAGDIVNGVKVTSVRVVDFCTPPLIWINEKLFFCWEEI